MSVAKAILSRLAPPALCPSSTYLGGINNQAAASAYEPPSLDSLQEHSSYSPAWMSGASQHQACESSSL